MGERILTVDEVLQRHVEHVMALCGGNKAQVARALDVNIKTINRWLIRWKALETAPSFADLL